jgi:hypothetical protein
MRTNLVRLSEKVKRGRILCAPRLVLANTLQFQLERSDLMPLRRDGLLLFRSIRDFTRIHGRFLVNVEILFHVSFDGLSQFWIEPSHPFSDTVAGMINRFIPL